MSRTPSRDKLALVVAELQYVRRKLHDNPKLAKIISEQITVIEQTIEMLHQTIWPLADSDYEYQIGEGNWKCVERCAQVAESYNYLNDAGRTIANAIRALKEQP